MSSKKPMVLVITDGYGHREERQDNAILNAGTPVMDRLWRAAAYADRRFRAGCRPARWANGQL